MVAWMLSAFLYPTAAHVGYYVAMLLVIAAAIARAVANGEARR